MERKIKLIWDMHGIYSQGTAEHHVVHLEEFAKRTAIATFGFGSEIQTAMHCIAYMIVDEPDMMTVRDALKPHRAELAE